MTTLYYTNVAQPPFRLFGIAISSLSMDDAIKLLLGRLARRERTKIAFANSNFLMSIAKGLLPSAPLANFLVLNDGLALDLIARCLGHRFPANLAGTDLIPEFLRRTPSGTRVFLLGARPGVAASASDAVSATTPATVCGVADGYSITDDTPSKINASKPDILIVGMGNPIQEKWILANAHRLDAPIIFGAGALLDFMSGRIARAPRWMRLVRLEWAFRLAMEPRRLFGRYTWDMAHFFVLSWRNRNIGANS